MKTLSNIITEVSTKYGAPMGRPNVGKQPITVVSGPHCRIIKKNQVKIYDSALTLNSGGYDKGGAYWGLYGKQLRVRYTKDISYIEFYRA